MDIKARHEPLVQRPIQTAELKCSAATRLAERTSVRTETDVMSVKTSGKQIGMVQRLNQLINWTNTRESVSACQLLSLTGERVGLFAVAVAVADELHCCQMCQSVLKAH